MHKSFLSLKLALRFLHSKRYGALANFISFASIAGITTGVAALILGLSAMNGFEHELNNRVLSLIPAATITSYSKQGFETIEDNLSRLEKNQHIKAVAPAVSLQGAFSHETNFKPALVLGIDSKKEKEVISLERFMTCKTSVLDEDTLTNPVILGAGIAKDLKLKIGDTINFATVDSAIAKDGFSSMVNHEFTIVGLFKTGGQIDHNFAFVNLDTAKTIGNLSYPNTIHVKVDDMLQVDSIVYFAADTLEEPCKVSTWIETQGKLYHDICMIRKIMYLAMVLIIGVASFNIVSNLVMAVSEKRREIAILKTMGATNATIVRSFTFMGLLSAIRGCTLGTIIGCALSFITPYVTAHFKAWFGIELLNEDIYFINFIPTRLMSFDVVLVVSCALLMSVLASIYPAIKASLVDPAKEINL